MKLTDAQIEQLRLDGFVFFRTLLPSEQTTAVLAYLEMLWQQEGAASGSENYQESNTRRLANLADKGDLFRPIFTHPTILEACKTVMGPNVRLSMLNARDALPKSGARQMWHCDTDNSGRPDEQGFYSCTAIWLLDDFTEENGATYFVPRTHLTGKVPKDVLEDRYAPQPDEIRVFGKRGDVFVFNGHCWHAGGENRSNQTRRALLAHYLRADKLPQQADRRQVLSAETIDSLSQAELEILAVGN